MALAQAERILRRVSLFLRLRRFLLATGFSFSLSLLVFHGLRLLGLSVSPFLFGLFALPPLFALLWPLDVEKRLFWCGRRLGVGGRLAGLSAALRRGNPVFILALSEDCRPRLFRLLFPEVFATLVPLVLVPLLLLPAGPPSGVLQPFPPLEEAREERPLTLAGSSSEERAPEPQISSIPKLPPQFAGSFPTLALSLLFGEEVPLEEAVQRLAQEEGLLRRLAELLAQASRAGSLAEVAPEVAGILQDLSRPDLRTALAEALAPGQEELEKAQALVEAALEGVSSVQSEISAPSPPAREEGTREALAETGGTEVSRGEGERPAGEILMDTEAEWALRRELEGKEEGLGLGVGREPGAPPQLGIPREWEEAREAVTTAVRAGEGPARAGVALALPGEPSAESSEGEVLPAPQEVELLLKEASLPPALREVVRRYFELLWGGGP